MSRCFPYTPPNYQREEEKSLAKPIKKELETTKEKRKEKRSKKKERKEKRDKSKDKNETSKHKEHGHKKRKHEERNKQEIQDGHKLVTSTNSTEQLEKSGLTEEHGVSCHPTQEPCESSESTQNSSKKRKVEATNIVNGDSHRNAILRFKFSFQKHKDPKPTPAIEEPCIPCRTTSKDAAATPANEEPCFSGWATEAPLGLEIFKVAPSNHNLVGNAQAESCAMIKSNKATEAPKELELVDHSHRPASSSSKSSKRAQKLERRFRDLLGNWKPAPFLLDAEAGTEDQGWLFANPRQHQANSDAQSCGLSRTSEALSHSFQPRACYLPELETYQLPYAVPF
ncbi:uncharacterized protein A4U43_C04F21280 [Asparagus officinalis]|uniref:Uncharacterized protein n=1 Tax=Asparagus officinalis TaxID=4686 RepID=A0A5P1F2P4_ASPOF|nr:DNA ligase 1-like [Asparagus officinalis]ONK72618.1 uncharacterized protein A4U43_C04F21280 [Asparagus officinalis]